MEFLDWESYGNTARTWLIALLLAFALLRLARVFLLRALARRAASGVDDVAVEVLGGTRGWFLVGLSLWAGSLPLRTPACRPRPR